MWLVWPYRSKHCTFYCCNLSKNLSPRWWRLFFCLNIEQKKNRLVHMKDTRHTGWTWIKPSHKNVSNFSLHSFFFFFEQSNRDFIARYIENNGINENWKFIEDYRLRFATYGDAAFLRFLGSEKCVAARLRTIRFRARRLRTIGFFTWLLRILTQFFCVALANTRKKREREWEGEE